MAAYAEKLAREPARMRASDLAPLRAVGLEDAAIHELVQVAAYFNYINRVADALRVDLEPEMEPYPSEEGAEGAEAGESGAGAD